MKIITRIFDRKGAPVLALIFAMLFLAERGRQLRKRKVNPVKRLVINTAVSLPAFSLLRFLMLPVMLQLATQSKNQKFGLNYRYRAHLAIKAIAGFLLLDYTNYLWHILNHKAPILWRFHLVHHTDPDLDVSTALRFHFGELIGSVFFRGACVFLSGVSPAGVLIYEIFFEAATQFHHSNWRLPLKTETLLNRLIVTPRMHGIHHSVVKRETDSNYSVIFSWWDRLHGTSKLTLDNENIVTGVPAYGNFDELTIGYLLRLPFGKIRPWQ